MVVWDAAHFHTVRQRKSVVPTAAKKPQHRRKTQSIRRFGHDGSDGLCVSRQEQEPKGTFRTISSAARGRGEEVALHTASLQSLAKDRDLWYGCRACGVFLYGDRSVGGDHRRRSREARSDGRLRACVCVVRYPRIAWRNVGAYCIRPEPIHGDFSRSVRYTTYGCCMMCIVEQGKRGVAIG